MNYFASYAMSPYILPLIYQLTVLPSWSSLNWHNPPSADSSKWNQWKVSMSPPTLTSFLRPFETFRHWHHFYDGAGGRTMDLVRNSPPSISSRTVRDQKVKCPPHQNIPLREQIERKNVRDVKWTATVWFLNCILLWFSKKILLALDQWCGEGGDHSF